jgi:hypothetical protein
MLTKKDYTAIAVILNKAVVRSNRVYLDELDSIVQVTNELSDYFIDDNPNFNRDRFKSAILK